MARQQRVKLNGHAGAFGMSHKVMPVDKLPVAERLKLARGIIDKTCTESGAGYLLLMFVPGSDMVMRSFHGIDSRDECRAVSNEVIMLMAKHAETFPKPEKPPEVTA